MTDQNLRDRLSIFLLCSQIAVPAVLALAYFCDGFTKEEYTQINEMVVPMVAAVAGYAITHIVKTRSRRSTVAGEGLSALFVGTAMTIPILFLTSIAAMVGMKAFNWGMRDFEDLKLALALLNELFGGACGTLLRLCLRRTNTMRPRKLFRAVLLLTLFEASVPVRSQELTDLQKRTLTVVRDWAKSSDHDQWWRQYGERATRGS